MNPYCTKVSAIEQDIANLMHAALIDFLDIHSKVVTFFHTDRLLRKIASELGFTINHFEMSSWKLLKLKLGQDNTYILQLENPNRNNATFQ